jgi:hypothetical protein
LLFIQGVETPCYRKYFMPTAYYEIFTLVKTLRLLTDNSVILKVSIFVITNKFKAITPFDKSLLSAKHSLGGAELLSFDENFKKLKSNSKTKFKFKAKRANFG